MATSPRQIPASRQAPRGIPYAGGEGKQFVLQQFQGINTKASRNAIGDQQFSWLENLMPLGDGNLRALYGEGAPILTAAGRNIIYFYAFNIGSTRYIAVFYDDGKADAVNVVSHVVSNISNVANRFYNGGDRPCVSQWGKSGIVIVTTAVTDGYFAWDDTAGGTLYTPGNPAPSWLTGGASTNMPTGIQGTSIETFQARAWVDNGAVKFYSAPTNGASFSGSLGGGSFTSTDPFLRSRFVASRQANGFLYSFGDSSANVISNVQTGGSPIGTTFNNQNVDPQIGTAWPGTLQAFGRGLVFANPSGVYALFGGAAEKVSNDLDGLFSMADFTTTIPSGAVATIFGVRCYMLLIRVSDYQGLNRNVICAWDGQKWFIASAVKTLSYLASQEIDSVLSAWGTNGTDLFPLFQAPSASLNKVLQTKLWEAESFIVVKQVMRLYWEINTNTSTDYLLSGTLDALSDSGSTTVPVTLTSAGGFIQWQNNLNQNINWQSANGNITWQVGGRTVAGRDVNASGSQVGLTLSGTSSDFTIVAMAMLYHNQAPIGG